MLFFAQCLGETRYSCLPCVAADSSSPDTAQQGVVVATGLSAFTAAFMGKRAFWSRKLVRSLRTLPDGGLDVVHTYHRPYRLRDYAKPGGIRWMPAGVLCAASVASLGYHYAELGGRRGSRRL